MRILITGATGFVGRNLIPVLLQNKDNFLAIVIRNINKTKDLFKEQQLRRLFVINSNQENFKNMIKIFSPDIVIHLASYSTSNDDENSLNLLLKSNIQFGTHLLDALQYVDLKYFINIGSFSEYYYSDGCLNSAYLYSATKTAFRSIVKYYQDILNFRWINVIPYSIYGNRTKHKKVIDLIIDSIYSKDSIPMTEGNQKLDFINISDVVSFFINLIEYLEDKELGNVEFHLGTGVASSIRELASLIESIYQKKTNIDWGALDYRRKDIMYTAAPIYKTEKILNWKPEIILSEGIKRMKNNSCYYDKST